MSAKSDLGPRPDSKRQINKKRRREGKARHMLFKHEKIEVVSEPTCVLYISNAGLGNGLSRNDVYDWLHEYGTLTEIIHIHNKPFAFVKVQERITAEKMKALSGSFVKYAGREQEVEHYIEYITEVPEHVHNDSPDNIVPAGLTVLPEFVSPAEEETILSLLDWSVSQQAGGMGGQMKHRDVLHFGYEFKYSINNVTPDEPLSRGIPEFCTPIIERLQSSGYLPWKPDQLTVNKYLPGQGIPSHTDTHSAFLDPIISVSLGSQVSMSFSDPTCRSASVVLPRRSALIMSGESRYKWLHGLVPRKSDIIQTDTGLELLKRDTRVSLTFRKLRRAPCDCDYPEQCDSQGFTPNHRSCDASCDASHDRSHDEQENTTEITEEIADKLEQTHVHQVYDAIASHFSGTRHSQWPRVKEFISEIRAGSVVADIGCGNGKYLTNRPDLFMLGVERSVNLCKICLERGFDIIQGDILNIPLCDSSCDVVLCIAVIHHLCTEERRSLAIGELIRILKSGGRTLIYVWAIEQNKQGKPSTYLKNNAESNSPEFRPATSTGECSLPVHKNRTEFQSNDMLVPWNLKQSKQQSSTATDSTQEQTTPYTQLFHRYYHIFKQGELETLCNKVDGVRVVQSYYDQGNWCCILEKS